MVVDPICYRSYMRQGVVSSQYYNRTRSCRHSVPEAVTGTAGDKEELVTGRGGNKAEVVTRRHGDSKTWPEDDLGASVSRCGP